MNKAILLSPSRLTELTRGVIPWRLAADKSFDHIVITDPEGIVLYANKAAQEATGYSLKEMLGKKAGGKKLWGGLMSKEFYQAMWQTIKIDKQPFSGEVANRRKNGQQYIAQIQIYPVLDQEKNVKFFVAIAIDINEQKQLEKTKTEFVSLASHQLRTPLTSISLSLDLLLRGSAGRLSKEQKQALKDIYDDVHQTAALIEALLKVSRIDLGTFTIEPEPINLIKITENVLRQFLPQIANKKLSLKKCYDQTLPSVLADRNIIKVVLQNLLSNAVKYTPDTGMITLSIKKDAKAVIITVSDTGWGIPEDQKTKIFTKFFRAYNIVKKEASGTGLGLYLSKSLLEAAGGKIWFESEENKGTTFYASLPLSGMKTKIS